MFIILLVSGGVLFIAPPGRIAHWTNWSMFGLTKTGWQSVHTVVSLVFVIVGSFHMLDLNRRVLGNYLRRTRRTRSPFLGSLVWSLVLTVAVVAGTVMELPPFNLVTGLGEWATESWDTPTAAPPAPHAEEWRLAHALDQLGIDSEVAVNSLRDAGITVETQEETLAEIAERNHVTPAAVFQSLSELRSEPEERKELRNQRGAGMPAMGMGRKPLRVIAEDTGIGLETARKRLEAQGIEAGPEDSLRDIARANGRSPGEIWSIISGPPEDSGSR